MKKFLFIVIAFNAAVWGMNNKPRGINNRVEVVVLAQGSCELLKQKPALFSEAAAKNPEIDVISSFRPFAKLSYDYSFSLEDNGKLYRVKSPIASAVSLYVAHCDKFQSTVQQSGLSYFGFSGAISNLKTCPFVSFSKCLATPIRYSYGVTDPSFSTVSNFPYYDECGRPSQSKIGSVMVVYPSTDQLAKSKEFMYVDVEQEVKRENLFLGRTKARRVEQKEICVIGGMPISFPYKTFDICLPDFSEEWQYDGMDNEGRKVDCHGVTQREYNSRKRKIENSDDTPKAWRENYKKFCKYNERSINYVVNACFKNRNDSYNFQSLFYK